CGAPYGQYLLDDALAGKVPAKLQFFLAAWALTPAERTRLKADVPAGSRRSQVRVWCYAPGYLYPDRREVAGIKETTGFDARALPPALVSVTPTEVGKQAGLTEGWEAANKWGPKTPIEPLFTVAATPAETWATYADGSPAVVVRRGKTGTDVFLGIPALTPELVRALAKLAGVHVFTEDNSAVWATERYLSIQAHEAGPVVINTGQPGPVRDALDGKTLGQGPKVTVEFTKGETKVLRYGAVE
ncbi:MAG: hypothetical protein KKI08_07205, partial [Armatimonadetes bacterium]|nr:hypothetical protein [Armatimonadota bacterium]